MSRRRGNNEGSIYQRSDGRWVGSASIGYENEKRKRKHVYGSTRQVVAKKLHRVMRDVEQGLPITPERLTVERFLHQWLADLVKHNVRPRTFESYQMVVELHLAAAFGHLRLGMLQPSHVQEYLNRKLEAGLSPRTVQYHHAILRRGLGQAVKWGVIPRNVAKLVDPPRVKYEEVKPLLSKEVQQLLDTIHGDRLEALYVLAIATGMRQGELLGLRWNDVDLEVRSLRVHTALQRIDSKFQLVEPKSRSSRRTIDLPQTSVAALRQHKVEQLQERLLTGSEWEDWSLVFTTQRGTPIEASNLIRAFHRLLTEAGLRRIRFHDLRHTTASMWLAQGVPARVVMELLGHSQITLTMNTYSHVMPELRREAADSMDAVLAGRA